MKGVNLKSFGTLLWQIKQLFILLKIYLCSVGPIIDELLRAVHSRHEAAPTVVPKVSLITLTCSSRVVACAAITAIYMAYITPMTSFRIITVNLILALAHTLVNCR